MLSTVLLETGPEFVVSSTMCSSSKSDEQVGGGSQEASGGTMRSDTSASWLGEEQTL